MTDTNLNLHPRDAHDETHDEQRPEEETFEVKHREKMSAKDLKDILGFSVLGAYIHRAAAKKRLKAAVGHIDACIYDAIRDFFKENIWFSQEDLVSFEGSEDFENLNEKQQHYFLRLAHSTIAINKLADEALVAQRKSNEKRVEKVHEENEQRRELAAKLRAEAEEYQEQIEVKIKEAQEYLNERKYKEALNAGREGEALLTGEKNSVLHLWRKAMAGAMKLLIGKEKDCKEFFDVIIQEYHREFQHTIKLAEAGLQYEWKKARGEISSHIPRGTWERMYRGSLLVGFMMPGLPYNLEIVKRVKHGDKLRYIVQQSKPQRGERRYAVTDEVGQPFSDLGFFLKYELKLSPQAAPELFIQREKNSPMKKVTD